MPLGADFLQLDPERAPVRGFTTWLTDAIRAAVIDGRLSPGAALPASRTLADELTVSRGVVVEAYRRLKDEGIVTAHHGAGTVVAPRTAAAAWRLAPHESRPVETCAAQIRMGGAAAWGGAGGGHAAAWGGAGVGHAATGRLPRVWRDGVDVDLSPGVPDLGAFPRAAWLRAERAVLATARTAELGYGDPRGSARLRGELAGWLARSRGLRARPDEIVIVAGVAQALALCAHTLRAKGHTAIAVEDPGSRGTRDELAFWGLTPVPVPVDEDGLRTSELRGTGVRAVAVTPAHQFPAGVVLAPRRRRELLDWAARAGGVVIEDDYDAEFRYDRAPVPAMQASAPRHVAYAGSVSKTLAPGMRLGWLVPPPDLYDELVTAKHASDLGSPALPQLVLAQLIASGELDRHIRLVRHRYRKRRDALLAAIGEFLPTATVRGVAAGLHLLITFPGQDRPGTDAELADRARAAGVHVQPLSLHRLRDGEDGLVMSYASNSPDKLHDGVRRLAEVMPR